MHKSPLARATYLGLVLVPTVEALWFSPDFRSSRSYSQDLAFINSGSLHGAFSHSNDSCAKVKRILCKDTFEDSCKLTLDVG